MAHKTGTLDNPIVVRSFGDEQYAGCTGCPADSHVTIWLTVRPHSSFSLSSQRSPTPQTPQKLTTHPQQMSRDRPIERCPECGNVLKMEYVGPMDDPHAHGGHGHGEDRT